MARCNAITKTGHQCSRIAKSGSKCYQHAALKVQSAPMKKKKVKPIGRKTKSIIQKLLKKSEPTPRQQLRELQKAKLNALKYESIDYISKTRRSRDNPFASRYMQMDRDDASWAYRLMRRITLRW